jgi:hypothetical protein
VDTQKTLLVPIVVYMAGAVALLSAPATAEQHTQSAEAALAVTLTPDEASSLTSKGTTSVAAYDAFLRGMRYLNVRDEVDVGGTTGHASNSRRRSGWTRITLMQSPAWD